VSPVVLETRITGEHLDRNSRPPHASQPWNPLVANVFYRRGIIDEWGRGTLKIMELTEQAGLVAPEFDVRGGEVVITFRPLGYVPPSRVSRPLSPLQQQLLATLSQIGPASLGEVYEHLGIDTPKLTVQDNLQVLRDLELVELNGIGRGARWRLI